MKGRIQDFYLGGRAKDYVRTRTSRSRTPKSLTAGVQGRLKGPWKLSGVLMLSRAIWALFYAFSYKMRFKKKVYQNVRGVPACCAPLPLNPLKLHCKFKLLKNTFIICILAKHLTQTTQQTDLLISQPQVIWEYVLLAKVGEWVIHTCNSGVHTHSCKL